MRNIKHQINMKIKLSPLIKELSGKLGDVVFRRCGDKVIACRRPTKSKRKPTQEQHAHRNRFIDAVQYANRQVRNPVAKAEYETRITENRLSAHAVAMADFFHPPVIELIDTSAYHGNAGETIVIKAVDDFRVTSVLVAIKCDGLLTEEGEALRQGSTDYWHYTSKVAYTKLSATRICVAAIDKPGNMTTAEKLL